jgi:hypothetical protein
MDIGLIWDCFLQTKTITPLRNNSYFLLHLLRFTTQMVPTTFEGGKISYRKKYNSKRFK